MNLKTTYILFGVLLAVLLLFAATQFSGCQKGGTDKDTYLFADFNNKKSPVKTSDIDTVRIERPAANQTIVFTRGAKDSWQMTQPYALRTESYPVTRVVDEVTGAKREEGTEKLKNLEQYGLKEPLTVVTLKKGDQEWQLNIGNETGKNGVVYVSTGAKPDQPLVVSRSSLGGILDNKLNDFREKNLLTANTSNTTAVRLEAGTTVLALEKNSDGQWRFQKPAYGPANYDSDPTAVPAIGDKKATGVRDLIDDAGGLRVETNDDFIADGVSDADLAGKYGLEKGKPETLRIEAKTKPLDGDAKSDVLLIGKKAPPPEEKKDDKKEEKKEEKKPEVKPDYYYARLESETSVVRVPAAKVKPLLDVAANPDPLRSHDLVSVSGTAKIDAIDVQAAGNTVKLRQADNKWTLYDKGPRGTDADAVRELVEAVSGKKQVKTFEAKEDGLEFDRPAAVVSVWLDGIKKEEKKEDEKKDEDKKDGDKKEEKKDEKKEEKEPVLKSDKPSVKLTFGKRDRDKNLVFVRRESGEDRTIVTVSDSVLDKVTAGPLAYLDRRLPTFADAFNMFQDVTKLTLTRGGQTWEVKKEKVGDKTEWHIVQPQNLFGRKANEFSITTVLQDLAGLRAEKYVAEKPGEKELDELYALKTPATKAVVTVTKGDKSEDWVYSFGKQSDNKMGVYSKENKSELVYLVPSLTVENLGKVEFRDLSVFNFDPKKVKGVEISVWSNDLGGPITLNLERKGDNDWAKKDGLITPDGAKVDNFLASLSRLQATKFLTPKPGAETGLDVNKKALKVKIDVEGGPLELLVGNEAADEKDPTGKPLLYASSNKLQGDVFLVPEAVFKDAKASPAYFRKP